jgi:hypothetical protein
MTVSFRVGRYLVAMLGEWCFPLVIGIAVGIGLSTWQLTEEADLIEEIFTRSLQSVVESCTASTDPPPSRSPPASGTGSPVAGDGGETG